MHKRQSPRWLQPCDNTTSCEHKKRAASPTKNNATDKSGVSLVGAFDNPRERSGRGQRHQGKVSEQIIIFPTSLSQTNKHQLDHENY